MRASENTIGHRSAATGVSVSPAPSSGRKSGYRHPSLPDSFGTWIAADGALDVRADLTFRQVICVDSSDQHLEYPHRRKMWINDRHAIDNISKFLHRLNYDCYKSAYKRYGKRIKVSSTIEGGVSDLREEWGTKRLHAHLLLEKPNHIDFDAFRAAITKNWVSTKWGYNELNIEMIKSLSGSAAYQVIEKMDALDIQNTYLG
jgi:hypothetical protein